MSEKAVFVDENGFFVLDIWKDMMYNADKETFCAGRRCCDCQYRICRNNHIFAVYVKNGIGFLPQHTFENDWLHFDFSTKDKEADFLGRNIPFETPVQMNLNFLSFCIKSIAYEKYSNHPYKDQSIRCLLYTSDAADD